MPPLPVISGRDLIRFLEPLGYEIMRQRGSHVRLQLHNERGTWSVTVPDHKEIKRGTLRGIIGSVSEATGLDVPTLVRSLSKQK